MTAAAFRHELRAEAERKNIMKHLNHSRMMGPRLLAAAVLMAGAASALAGVHYVDVNSTNATPPYTNWTTATTNIPIVVESSTNLANAIWVPLQSLNLTNGSFYFSDPNWSNYPARVYRIRSP